MKNSKSTNLSRLLESATPAPAPVQEPEQVGEESRPPAKARTKPKTPKPTTKESKGATATTERIGVYMSAALYDAMKSAYISDWEHAQQFDVLPQWIAAALEAHAARTPAQRVELAQAQPPTDKGPAGSRTFTLPARAVEAMHEAMRADEREHQYLSVSRWSVIAITAAIEAARARNGGSLPPAPLRLPNRLRRH